MARSPLTSAECDDFRSRATIAGTRMLAERGPERLSMRSVATELGVSAMTPYRYFENKEHLITLVRASAFRRFADRQEKAAAMGGTVAQTIKRLGLAYVGFALDEPDAYRIMFQQSEGAGQPEVEQEALRGISYLNQTVERGVAEGVYRGDSQTLAQLKWATIHGIVSLHLAGKLVMDRSVIELVEAALTEEV
ncbi:MAG: AcrR family transcriptional regulator [Bradymonadia bacterium]|jgi:AcrR family transcriptional regulator